MTYDKTICDGYECPDMDGFDLRFDDGECIMGWACCRTEHPHHRIYTARLSKEEMTAVMVRHFSKGRG